MAMVLVDLKRIGEEEAGVTVTDCAITVPTYFGGTGIRYHLQCSRATALR